jgi:hypothetical protein
MPPPRVILSYFLRVLIYGVVLLAPWPGVTGAHAAFFRWTGNMVFAQFWFWPDGTVKFKDPNNLRPGDIPPGVTPPPAIGVKDTLMILENRKTRTDFGFLRTSSRYIGYMPLATFIALALATPVAWRRRLIALGWGLLLVEAFVILRLTLTLAVGYCGTKAYALFNPGPRTFQFLGYIENVLQDDPTVSFVAPVFIWIALLFRPSRWAAMSTGASVSSESKSKV